MKFSLISLLMICTPLMVTAQQKHLPEEGSLGPTIRLETGLYIPLGEFEKAISPSPSLSIIGGIKLNEKWRIDPGLTLFLPQSNNKVLIVSQKSTVTGRINTLSGHLGASINRVEKLGSRIFMEARAGTGFSFLQTDKEKENVPDDSNDNFYGSETIFLNAGLGFKIFAFKQSYIGLEFNYYFTPYNLFGQRFVDSIGNQAISIGVSYGL